MTLVSNRSPQAMELLHRRQKIGAARRNDVCDHRQP